MDGVVPVVGLLQDLWRRGHVQGALLHEPEVHMHGHAHLIHTLLVTANRWPTDGKGLHLFT